MPFDLAIQEFNRIEALRQEIDFSLIQRPVEPIMLANDIAWRRSSGSNEAGVKVIFPVKMFGNRAKKRSPYEHRGATKPEFGNFSVVHEEFSPDGESIPRGTQLTDIYGMFADNLPMILSTAQLEYDQEMADLLGNGHVNVTEYDALPFFTNALGSGSHQANPNRNGLATFDNYKTAATLNRANIIAGLNALFSVPGPNGLPMMMPGKMVLVVSNKDQEFRARVELNAAINASTAGTASQTNVLQQMTGPAEVRCLANLQQYDDGKGWYMFKVVNEKHRPVVLSMIEPWQVYIEGMNDPNAHSRVTRNVIQYGVNSFWGLGYLWPHLGYKFVEP